MFTRIWFRLNSIYRELKKFLRIDDYLKSSDIKNNSIFIDEINNKIGLIKRYKKKYINLINYRNYFIFFRGLGLEREIFLNTTLDNLKLRGIFIQPLLSNDNNKKMIIFCHGITNDCWSLFYPMHLALQRGYQIISYDSRNHGNSEKFFSDLGQKESYDLQDVVDWVENNTNTEKIGMYGFSMGASTLLFWISFFGNNKKSSKVSCIICESPYDSFSAQLKRFVGGGINSMWKNFLISKAIKKATKRDKKNFEKLSPILVLPRKLPINLLLLHGLEDKFIDWKASFNIWFKLKKNKENEKKVYFYLFRYADHGQITFLGDHIPKSLIWRDKKITSRHTFSSLFFNYLKKNL